MAYPTTSAAAASIANCGSLGVALQQALEEIRRQHNDDDDDNDDDDAEDHADRILEALGMAVAATTIPNQESRNSSSSTNSIYSNYNNYLDDDPAGLMRQPQHLHVLTATVDYYNRLGDRWRIVAVPDSAALQLPPPPPVPRPDDDDDEYNNDYGYNRTKKRKRPHQIHATAAATTPATTATVPLSRIEVLAYKKDYSK